MLMSKTALAIILLGAGFTYEETTVMMCIAKWESSYRIKAIQTNKDGSKDVGLFQINEKFWSEVEECSGDMFNPAENVKCAKKVFDEMGYRGWIAFRDRQECQDLAKKE